MPHALWALGRAQVRERRIVGYWAWELPQSASRCGRPGFRFVHEIWVPSQLSPATPLPRPPTSPCMSCRIRCRHASHAEHARKLDLPDDALIVLNVFHLGSAFTRKNPLAAIAAFRRAFGERRHRMLVIKLIDNAAGHARQRGLHEAIAGASNIRLIEGMLPEADMAGLMAASDIVISLHRSEGFGLVPAQAMHLGKPVIATAWSGNLEFMTKRNSALVPYSLVPVARPGRRFRRRRPDVGGRRRRGGCRLAAAARRRSRTCAPRSAPRRPTTSPRSFPRSLRRQGRRARPERATPR